MRVTTGLAPADEITRPRETATLANTVAIDLRPRRRWIVAATMTLLALAAVGMLAALSFERFEVVSGSMAPKYLGPHRLVACAECGFRFAVGSSSSDQLPTIGAQAVCPNCSATSDLDSLPDQPGDRLRVSRFGLYGRRPERWQPIVYRDVATGRPAIKRVAGLPGEQIQVIDGDVYIDGRLARKTLDRQRDMAVVVHDSGYPSRDSRVPPRWAPLAEFGDGPSQDRLAPLLAPWEASSMSPLAWIGYRHWRRQGDRFVPAPIEDTNGYNQGRAVVDAQPIDELSLSIRAHFEGDGELIVVAPRAEEVLAVVFDLPRHAARLLKNGRGLGMANLDLTASRLSVEVSTIDGQFVVACNGRTLFAPEPLSSAGAAPAGSAPFVIGATGLTIDRLVLSRDVYYSRPRGAAAGFGLDGPCQLGDDEYFVLGDNPLVSADSRTTGPIEASQLVGAPY